MSKTVEETNKKTRQTGEEEKSMTLLVEDTQRQRLERRLRDKKLRRGLTTSEALKLVNTRKPRRLPR